MQRGGANLSNAKAMNTRKVTLTTLVTMVLLAAACGDVTTETTASEIVIERPTVNTEPPPPIPSQEEAEPVPSGPESATTEPDTPPAATVECPEGTIPIEGGGCLLVGEEAPDTVNTEPPPPIPSQEEAEPVPSGPESATAAPDTPPAATVGCPEGTIPIEGGECLLVGKEAPDTDGTDAAERMTSEPESDPPPVVGVSSSLERCASAGSPGSGVLAVLAGTSAEGVYQPIVGPGSPGSCERIMEWWEQARRAEAERIDRGEYPCRYFSPPEGYDFGDAGRTHGPPYFVGCWPVKISHDAPALYVYPPNSPPFVEAVWNCYKTALEGSPPGWDGYWWPTIVDCHYNLLQYGYPMYGIGIDPACAAESYTRRVAESLIGDRPFDDGYYSGPNSWTNCSSRAERMVPDTGQTFQQRCLAVIAVAAKDPHTAENIEQQAAVYGVEPSDYLTEWGNIVCGDWSVETIKNAEINGIPLDSRVFIAHWHVRPEAQCHQQVILNLAESYLRGGTETMPATRYC